MAFVCNLAWDLGFERNASPSELDGESVLVQEFQEAGPQYTMHFEGGADDCIGSRVVVVNGSGSEHARNQSKGDTATPRAKSGLIDGSARGRSLRYAESASFRRRCVSDFAS